MSRATSSLAGEDAVVARLSQVLSAPGREVLAGIGDDCAVVRAGAGRVLLLKTDCVVEGVHFLAREKPERVGWKAVCRAVSDVAACGGRPRQALITCVVPARRTGRWLTRVYAGIERARKAWGFDVVGGELAVTDGPAVLNVALTGEAKAGHWKSRAGGRPGHALYVTGWLGASLASGWHLDFIPRVIEARWLVRHAAVGAMMDLSDGLARDLPRLARASGCGFRVDPQLLPRRPGATVAQASGDGEDFELLFSAPSEEGPRLERAWRRRFPELPLTRIGSLTPPGCAAGLGRTKGWDHFARKT